MNLANGPLVVIPEPIRSMGWSYDVERSILEPLGIRLVVPDDRRTGGRGSLPEADVVFTSSRLTADDIDRLGSQCAGILCYSVGMDYVDAAAAKARGIPIWNCPTSNNEEVCDHAMLLILAAQRRLAAARAGRARTATGTCTSGRSWASSTGCSRGRSGSSGSAGSATWSPRSSTASGRRSSPTTRTSRGPATPRSSWSPWTSWRPGPTSSSRARP